jgi:hypothetical protein
MHLDDLLVARPLLEALITNRYEAVFVLDLQ